MPTSSTQSTINIKIKVDGKSASDNVGGVSQSFGDFAEAVRKNQSSFASFSDALEKNKAFTSLANAAQRSRQSVTALVKSAGELIFALKNIASAAQIAFLPFQNLVVAGADFEAQMDRVAAISGATQENLERMTDTARYLGSTTKYSASEAAKGMEYLALAGMSANDTIVAMPGLLSLAAASGEELATISDIVSDQLSALGMHASETGRLANAMAKAMSASNTTVGMLGESMKYSSPVFATAGQSMETLIAATSLLANVGIKGSQSGTSLRMSMLRLAAPPKAAATELKRLGIEVSDSQGRFRDFSDILKDFAMATANLMAADKLGSVKKVVGVEAASAFIELINQSQVLTDEMGNQLPTAFEKFRTQIERSNNGMGAAAKMAKKMSDNLAGDWKTLLSSLEGFYITIYYGIVDILREIVQDSTVFIRQLTVLFEGIGDGLAPLTNIFKGLSAAFKPISNALKPVIKAFYEWIGASKETQTIAYSLGEMLGSTLYYAVKILITPFELIVEGLVLLGKWLGKVSAQFTELTAGMTFAEKLRYAIFSVTLWLSNLNWAKFGYAVIETFINGIMAGGHYLYTTVENIFLGITNLFSSDSNKNLAKSAGQSFVGNFFSGVIIQVEEFYRVVVAENEWLSMGLTHVAIALSLHFEKLKVAFAGIGKAFLSSGLPLFKNFLVFLVQAIPTVTQIVFGLINAGLRLITAFGGLANVALLLVNVFKDYSGIGKVFLTLVSLATLLYTQWEKILAMTSSISEAWNRLDESTQKSVKSIVLGIGLITLALKASPFIALLSAFSYAVYEYGERFTNMVNKIVDYLIYFKNSFIELFTGPFTTSKGLILTALAVASVAILGGLYKIRRYLRSFAFAKECRQNPVLKCMIPDGTIVNKKWRDFAAKIREGQRGFQLMGDCSGNNCFTQMGQGYQRLIGASNQYQGEMLRNNTQFLQQQSADTRFFNQQSTSAYTQYLNDQNNQLRRHQKAQTSIWKNIANAMVNVLSYAFNKMKAGWHQFSLFAIKKASETQFTGSALRNPDDFRRTQSGNIDLRGSEINRRADELATERNIPKYTLYPSGYPTNFQTQAYKDLKKVAAEQAEAQRTIFQKMTNSMAGAYTNLSNHLRRETTQTTTHFSNSWGQAANTTTSRLKSFAKTTTLVVAGLTLFFASSAVAASEFEKVNDTLTFGEKVILKLNQAWLWLSNNLTTVGFVALSVLLGGVISLTTALGVAAAAVIGFFTWNIGTYFYNESETFREAAISIVGYFVELWDKIQAIWESIDFKILGESIIDSLFNVFDTGIPMITEMLNQKMNGLGDILMAPAKLIGELYNTVVETLSDIMFAFSEGDWVGIGVAVVKGIAKGMLSVVYMLKDILVGGFTVVADGIKKLIGWLFSGEEVKKEAEKFGKTIPDNVAQGVEQGTPQVQQAMDSTISEVSKANEKITTVASEIGASVPQTIAENIRQNNIRVLESLEETVSTVSSVSEGIQTETQKINKAFNFLGVESQSSIQAALQKTADLAKEVFITTWRNNLEVGIATTQEVEKSFLSYAEKAIAANQDIVSSQLNNVAVTLSLENELQALAASSNQAGQAIQLSIATAAGEMTHLKNVTQETTNEAFTLLGIESQKALQAASEAARRAAEEALSVLGVVSEQAATQALTAFETINTAYQNQQASLADVQNAFLAYAQIAIQSNQGVITSQMESTAAVLSLENELAQLGASGTQATNLLIQAMATVGTVSQESLQKTAETARQAFETVKKAQEQGVVSIGDVEKSFLAYAAQAIAANQGIVSSQLESVGATLSLESQLRELGEVAQQTLLEKTANSAKKAFETIQQASKQGMASIVDVRNAFLVYAEKAIVANQGVASSQLESIAKSLLLENELRKLAETGNLAGKQIAGSVAQATTEMEKLKEVSQEAVDEAFKTLGVESQKTLEEAANTAQQAFKTIQQASEQGVASLTDMNKAFLAYAEKAVVANQGVISSQLKMQAATLGLTEELKRLGQTGQEAGLQISERLNPATNSVQQLESQFNNTSDSIRQMENSVDGVSESSQVMGDQFNLLNDAIARNFADMSIAASQHYSELYTHLTATVHTFRSWIQIIGDARLKTEQLFEKQFKLFDKLSNRLDNVNYLTESEANQLENLVDGFDLLDQADLSGIRGQIESLRQNTEQLSHTIQNTLNRLRDELDRMKGDEEGIERRRYEEQIAELKQQLEEAKSSGDTDAIKNAKEALNLAKQLHKERLKEIEERQQAESKREKQQKTSQEIETSKNGSGGLSKRIEIEFKSPRGTNVSGSFNEQDAETLFQILEESGALAT